MEIKFTITRIKYIMSSACLCVKDINLIVYCVVLTITYIKKYWKPYVLCIEGQWFSSI